jgi:hypothetical protein
MKRETRESLEKQRNRTRSESKWRLGEVFRHWVRAFPVVLVELSLCASSPLARAWQVGGVQGAPPAPTPMIGSAPGSPLRMTLRVYDYAHLDATMLTRAREVATAIFKESGVETTWVDCPISAAEFGEYPACHARTEATHFVLRVMTASMAVKLPTSDHPLGFAHECRDDQPGCVANVFYARVAELARRSGTPPATILGHVMVHEVGHLLLGPNSDGSRGIMCGEWSLDDLRLMNWHYLFFTPRQSGQLRGSLLRRSTLEAGLAPNVSEHL